MNKQLTLVALLLSGQALADTKIPNTKVSYKLKTDALTDSNASMVFVDATEDTSGKTYVTFACDLGDPYFKIYTKTSIGNYSGDVLNFYIRVDGGSIKQGTGKLRESTQTGALTILETNLTTSAQALGMFLAANSKVVIRIERSTGSSVTYTFPTKGFAQAYRAIKSCD